MAKAVKIGDKLFRWRKGKLVEIPAEWAGHIPHKQTIRKRQPVKRRTRKEKP